MMSDEGSYCGWARYSRWKENRNEEGWKQFEDLINWGMPHRGSGNTKVYKGVICPSPTLQAKHNKSRMV